MKKSVQSSNVSLHVKSNNHQMMKLKLIDESTNIEYTVEVKKEDYNRAYKGIILILSSKLYYK